MRLSPARERSCRGSASTQPIDPVFFLSRFQVRPAPPRGPPRIRELWRFGAWTRSRIDVDGASARVFVHDAEQPALIVNDLKHGADARGEIGLYIDRG